MRTQRRHGAQTARQTATKEGCLKFLKSFKQDEFNNLYSFRRLGSSAGCLATGSSLDTNPAGGANSTTNPNGGLTAASTLATNPAGGDTGLAEATTLATNHDGANRNSITKASTTAVMQYRLYPVGLFGGQHLKEKQLSLVNRYKALSEDSADVCTVSEATVGTSLTVS